MNDAATPPLPTDPQALADAVAQAMWARDAAPQALGMQLREVRPGYARLAMPVREDMLNGHRICHGGLIFSLADTAFAYACNSYNRNTVAAACHIDFLAPGLPGDTLEAEAVEQSLAGRTGVYDVTVRDGQGRSLALFRGKSYRIAGEPLGGPPEARGAPPPA